MKKFMKIFHYTMMLDCIVLIYNPEHFYVYAGYIM